MRYVGAFPSDEPAAQASLSLSFSTASSLVTQRWRNKDISVDFLGDYFANFFPGDPDASLGLTSHTEAKAIITFVANELLENALKYNFDPAYPVSIALSLYVDGVHFKLTNSVDPAQID